MKILLSNAAYVGDTIVSTAVLPVLKSAFPDSQIGYLASSSSKEVVEDHRFVDWVHIYDHPKMNRLPLAPRIKKEAAKKSWKRALKEIREIGYDVAFELYSYYNKNAGPLLYEAAIPQRVAYYRCKCPYFFNDFGYWDWFSFHIVENHGKMLHDWGIEKCHLEKLRPLLEYKKEIDWENLAKRLPSEYILIHTGTGEPLREWRLDLWKKLALRLCTLGYPLVFIGKGKREKSHARTILEGVKEGVDWVDTLTLRETMEVVKRAKLVIGVDSMAGHLAAAFRVPGLFIYSGYALKDLWRPYSDTCEIFEPKGFDLKKECPPIGAINSIDPEEIFKKAVFLLEKYKNGVGPPRPIDLTLFDRYLK